MMDKWPCYFTPEETEDAPQEPEKHPNYDYVGPWIEDNADTERKTAQIKRGNRDVDRNRMGN